MTCNHPRTSVSEHIYDDFKPVVSSLSSGRIAVDVGAVTLFMSSDQARDLGHLLLRFLYAETG